MRRVLIFLSGVYLTAFGAFQIARFWLRYDFIMDTASDLHRMFLAMNFAVFSTFSLFSVFMGIGLMYMNDRARKLLLAISALALVFGISLLICSTYLYFMLPYGPATTSRIYGLYYWAHVTAFLIVMPAFFLIFFTRPSVVKLFSRKKQAP